MYRSSHRIFNTYRKTNFPMGGVVTSPPRKPPIFSTLHQKFREAVKINENKFLLLIGPQGSGKTTISSISSIESLNSTDYKRVIFVNCPKHLAFDRLLFKYSPEEINNKFNTGQIVFNSFNDIISREINNSIIIADNMQKYKLKHLSNLVNINGYKSKLIINGDVDKYDTKDTDLMLLRDIMNVQSYDFFDNNKSNVNSGIKSFRFEDKITSENVVYKDFAKYLRRASHSSKKVEFLL
jgi:energy-coupling factor transporter ATP-binding protein EcfA2